MNITAHKRSCAVYTFLLRSVSEQNISGLGKSIAQWTLTAHDGRLATSLGALVKSVGIGIGAVDVGM